MKKKKYIYIYIFFIYNKIKNNNKGHIHIFQFQCTHIALQITHDKLFCTEVTYLPADTGLHKSYFFFYYKRNMNL